MTNSTPTDPPVEKKVAIEWVAVFRLTHPTLDRPLRTDHLEFLPSPPKNRPEFGGHGCTHIYRFSTAGLDQAAQVAAEEQVRERWQQLVELAALCPGEATVKDCTVSIASMQDDSPGFSQPEPVARWMPAVSEGGPDPVRCRRDLEGASQVFAKLETLQGEPRVLLGRGLRWIHRLRTEGAQGDDSLIYTWIAFNSLYNAYVATLGSNRPHGERQLISHFAHRFPIADVTGGRESLGKAINRLASRRPVHDGRGTDVAARAKAFSSYAHGEATAAVLDLVYMLRNELFHGQTDPTLDQRDNIYALAATCLRMYLQEGIPQLVEYIHEAEPL